MTTLQSKTKCVRPPSNTRPTVTKTQVYMCPIHESTIDDDESNEGEDAIFCEDECQIWLYRKCVGLTKNNAFILIGKSKDLT